MSIDTNAEARSTDRASALAAATLSLLVVCATTASVLAPIRATALHRLSPGSGHTATTCRATKVGVHRRAPGRGRTVALTFDDGPGRSTGAVLKILKSHHVTATFFNIGEQMSGRRSVLRAEHADGDALGNHTWDHTNLADLDATAQARELDRTSKMQKHIVGVPPCLLRPPGGTYDATTLRLAAKRRLAVWLWSVDTEDWEAEGSASSYWVDRIISRAQAGISQRHPVILMHNPELAEPATVAALPSIIEFYRDQHYRFVTLLYHVSHHK